MVDYSYEISQIMEILKEVGVEFPLRFSDEQWMNDKLANLFDDVADNAYENGRDSVPYCGNECCY